MILQPHSKKPRELLLRAAVFVVMSLFSVMRYADAASSPQTPAQSGEVQVFASADESSPVIESAADGKALSPIAEMTGAGGLKWFMVKTGNGNVGWVKAGDKMGAAKIDDHFRSRVNPSHRNIWTINVGFCRVNGVSKKCAYRSMVSGMNSYSLFRGRALYELHLLSPSRLKSLPRVTILDADNVNPRRNE